jgi:hypothetical protein
MANLEGRKRLLLKPCCKEPFMIKNYVFLLKTGIQNAFGNSSPVIR